MKKQNPARRPAAARHALPQEELEALVARMVAEALRDARDARDPHAGPAARPLPLPPAAPADGEYDVEWVAC